MGKIIYNFVQYVLIGIIYYLLWNNDIFDSVIRTFRSEICGIIITIFLLNIITELLKKVFIKLVIPQYSSKILSIKTILYFGLGIIISFCTFSCVFAISFIITMQGM